MKTKIYLFRLTVAATAFLFSTGGCMAWRYFQSTVPTPKNESVQFDSSNVHKTYPSVGFEPVSKLPNPLVPEPAPETITAASETEAEFDPEGYYYIADELPKGFGDFENFNVMNKDYESEDESEYGKLVAPKGSVQTKKEFKFNRISIGGGQIQFETERIRGISYSFSGRFTETRNFIYLKSEEIEKVLEGRLIKKRKGVTVAERDVKFGWYQIAGCGC